MTGPTGGHIPEAGFRGVSFHHIVQTHAEVDEARARAEAAGGEVVRAAAGAQWDGYFGDPDGYLWKVASAS